MLTKSEKIIIYNLLLEKYHLKDSIPKDELIDYLKENGLDSKQFAYKSDSDLLDDLGEFLIHTSVEKKEYYLLKNYTEKTSLFKKNIISRPYSNSFNVSRYPSKPVHKKVKSLEPEVVDKVLSLFNDNLTADTFYHLNIVTKLLSENGINYKDFGFKKMKDFLSVIPSLTLKDKITNDIPSCYVAYSSSNASSASSKKKSSTKAKKNVTYNFPKFEEIYIPNKIILSAISDLKLEIDTERCLELIKKSYLENLKNNSFEIIDKNSFSFSLDNDTVNNVIVIIKKSTSKTSYDYFVFFLGKNEKIKASEYIHKFIDFDNFDNDIASLAKLAKEESWCFHNSYDKYLILKIYLSYTFYKLHTDDKVCYSQDKTIMCFNTGLYNDNYEDIYLLAQLKNQDSDKYLFSAFTTAGIKNEGKLIVENFNPLPTRPKYYNDTSEIIFDSNKTLLIDYEHILLDNISRLPLQFIYNHTKNKKILTILDELKKLPKEKASKTYSYLSHLIELDKTLYKNLIFDFERNVTLSLKEADYDPHLLLLSYYPTKSVISFLLPIKLLDQKHIECFLLLENMSSNNYQGQTILTLKQGYTNARLISPLNNTYLNPQSIED